MNQPNAELKEAVERLIPFFRERYTYEELRNVVFAYIFTELTPLWQKMEQELASERQNLKVAEEAFIQSQCAYGELLVLAKQVRAERDSLKAENEKLKAEVINLQARCLNVRDALNHYHLNKTQSAVDELDRVANGCNTSDLIARFPEHYNELSQLRQLCNFLFSECKIVYWPKDGSYPIEHNMAAQKDSRELLLSSMMKGKEG